MKKNVLLLFLLVLGVLACKQDPKTDQNGTSSVSLVTADNPEWQQGSFRVYPITIDANAITQNEPLSALKTTGQAINTKGFRITELKQFGRSIEPSVNSLTVTNKSQNLVFLMSGDVVTGGNQDRVIAQDQVIAANTIKNIEVFCVEHGRWHYFDENASESEKKVAAFTGYYNVASSDVRQAIHRSGNQDDVWKAVAKVTEANGAQSSSGTYAALETESPEKAIREGYIRFFDGKFKEMDNVVGMMVLNGDKILGVDIFGHPSLFQKQFSSLLHGYATDAVLEKNNRTASETTIKRAFEDYQAVFNGKEGTNKVGKFTFEGKTVHVFAK